ncbi:BglG family transcription antiterminator LicT [Oceanobacillus chungangensis]|uniref:Transcription antiterminator BglG n=1 Tax=Oceanobacillus chungangensis TaxID=1229152 RepID=A0A3D8PNH9_9BACI|nr:PRD domain-containing protein [Oceanobacillus chungangensis]RDW16705.1 transcription antiterminator BglG [Oceanobacillus chungangensis]
MKIVKVLNNNVVMTKNKSDQEMVVVGKGLAFQKKVGDMIDTTNIEKTFVLESSNVALKLAELMKDTPGKFLDLSYKILELAKSRLTYKLDDYLYVALTDHLSFAITRHNNGINLKNPLLWEIRRYYKQEFQIALEALDIVERETGVRLTEDEAASIALHLVNSQLSGENMMAAVKVTEMVNNILNIVKYYFKIELDEESINYERFLTHLRFFTIRFIRNEKSGNMYDNFLYEQVKQKYTDAFQCTERIANYIAQDYNWEISNDEKVYLTLHIHRITSRLSLNTDFSNY